MFDKWKSVDNEEKCAANLRLSSGNIWDLGGDEHDSLCRKLSLMSGNKHVLLVNNGTMALLLAGLVLNLSSDDEVIMPSYAYMASSSPAIITGAKIVFCDVNRESLTIDPDKIESLITPRTKAIIITHSWGNPADVRRIKSLSKRLGLRIISDNSHAHGASFGGKMLGEWADISCYSMGLGKLVTGGEMGAFTTDSLEFYEKAVALSLIKQTGSLQTIRVKNALPLKARPHGVAVAIANKSIDRLSELNAARAKFAEQLYNGIRNLWWLSPQKCHTDSQRVYYRIVMNISERIPLEIVSAIRDHMQQLQVPYVPEEYDEPLSQWSNIVGMNFTSHDRFSYQYTVSDIDESYIGNRTLHFWAIAQPTPANLANIIVDSIYKISKELGIDKWK